MLYSVTKSSEPVNQKLQINSDEALAFIYEMIAVSENGSCEVENGGNKNLAVMYDAVGVNSVFANDNLRLLKKAINRADAVIIDFSQSPHEAFAFAIACAANAVQADLKGLQNLSQATVSLLQRELYRFNINSDFCDYSKLKIFNNKIIQPKKIPVNLNDDLLSLYFIPLAIVFGKIEIELSESFFEKYSFLNSLFPLLGLNLKKTQ